MKVTENQFVKKNLILLVLLVLSIIQVYAIEKSFILGGENGWKDSILASDKIDLTEGYLGYEGLHIANGSHALDEDIDLYISFEDDDKFDLSGNYEVLDNRVYHTENAAVGRKAAVSREKNTMLSLMGGKKAIFGKFGSVGSFSIEFYLNPAVCVSGENVFFWRSSQNIKQYSDYQTIEASFMNGKMKWKFLNVFFDVNQNSYDLYLTSRSTIMPEKWSHHYICYDEDEGMLEYYVDGHLEDLIYTTDSGNAYGHFLIPDLGSPAKIELCKNFAGSIDEFVISHELHHYLDSSITSDLIPYFVSKPLKTDKNGCKLLSLTTTCTIPAQTEIQFFVRSADNFYELNDLKNSSIKWTEVREGVPVNPVSGRYFQVASYFYSDGVNTKSPILSEIQVNYEESELPIAPSKIYTECFDDGTIKVSWSDNNFDKNYGYLLYYGNQSGEFIGVGLEQGDSPIDCGTETSKILSGLKIGQIYYFAVASYLLEYPEIIGESSKEVFARPLVHEKNE